MNEPCLHGEFTCMPDECNCTCPRCPGSALALWTRASSWAARNLTGGFVPSGMPARFCGDPEAAVQELLDRGSWMRTRGGYQFREWRRGNVTEISYPYEVPKPGEPQCQADGTRNGPDGPGGTEHYWSCTAPGTVEVDGMLMCEDHAGGRGYGPRREEYGFGPLD